jgi:hypothetical protein
MGFDSMVQKIPGTIIVVAALVFIAAITIILAVQSSEKTALLGQPDTVTLSTLPARVTTPADNHATVTHPVTTTATTAITDSSPKKDADECSIVPDTYGYMYQNTTVFTPESHEKYCTPAGKKEPGITLGQAKDIAMKAFQHYSPDRIGMEYVDGTDHTYPVWKFDLFKDDQQVVTGELNPDGDIRSYGVTGEDNSFKYRTRPELVNTQPAITLESARRIAENEIRERNGDQPLKLMDSGLRYGNYVFTYHRTIHGVPTDNNYVIIDINAENGKICGYTKAGSTPENAVAAQSVPAISREAAIALVERKAKACYPESADSFRMISADLRWMDSYNDIVETPKPGVIPLGWYVRFDDTTIQEMKNPHEGEAWVDAQNGTLLSLYYIHYGS